MTSETKHDAWGVARLALILRSPLLWISGLITWLALSRGQDRNWDLLNYHAYNPYALLHGRHLFDLMPAQLQSWYNPLLDLPFYALATTQLSGQWVSLWLALPTVLATWIASRLAARLCARPLAVGWQVLMVLMMLSGAASFSQLATTFNEWPVAFGVLLSFYLLQRHLHDDTSGYRPLVWAGLVGGATCGLKLTAVSYAVGLALVVIAFAPRQRIRCISVFGVAGLVGALLTAGGWMFWVWQVTDNPVFPYVNQVFGAANALPIAYTYDLHKPAGFADALMGLLHLAQGGRYFSEVSLKDPRLLLGTLFALLACFSALKQRLMVGTSPVPLARVDREWLACAVFFLGALAAWFVLHSIYRYTIALELLAVVLLAGAISRLSRRSLRAALWLLAALALATTKRPNWERQQFTTPFLENQWPALPAGSVVASFSSEAIGYAVVGIPPEVPVFGLSSNLIRPDFCVPWQRAALAQLDQAAVAWNIRSPGPIGADEARSALVYGYAEIDSCLRLPSTLGDLQLCRLQRVADGTAGCRQLPDDSP